MYGKDFFPTMNKESREENSSGNSLAELLRAGRKASASYAGSMWIAIVIVQRMSRT